MPKKKDLDPIENQPALPDLELPDYHGRKPIGMKTAVNGAGNRISRSHDIGERLVIVLEARVRKAGHEETDDGLIYAETLKVVDLFEIGGDPGKRLLSNVRQAYRSADDASMGRTALPGGEGWTDGSGTALTPDEVAEIRGDPTAAMRDERATPVVVVFSDGLRQLWPDEFDKDAPRPAAGDRFEDEGETAAGYTYAAQLLDASTGETLAEWTDEQEAARLLELEQAAETEEKATTDSTTPEANGDRLFLARGIAKMTDDVAALADVLTVRRLIKAEREGKNRKNVVDLLSRRATELNGLA